MKNEYESNFSTKKKRTKNSPRFYTQNNMKRVETQLTTPPLLQSLYSDVAY
ncbi:MAG: hypothetical protein RJA07_2371 [Bacteroidota bacterium]|jgi:hypothetical protein